MSKPTALPTKLGGSKKKMLLLNKIKLTWTDSLNILFPGLFDIIVQSALGSAIPFF